MKEKSVYAKTTTVNKTFLVNPFPCNDNKLNVILMTDIIIIYPLELKLITDGASQSLNIAESRASKIIVHT